MIISFFSGNREDWRRSVAQCVYETG